MVKLQSPVRSAWWIWRLWITPGVIMKSKHPTLVLKEVGGRNIFLEIPAILDANFGLTPGRQRGNLVDHPNWSAQESELSVFEGSGNSSRTPRKTIWKNLRKKSLRRKKVDWIIFFAKTSSLSATSIDIHDTGTPSNPCRVTPGGVTQVMCGGERWSASAEKRSVAQKDSRWPHLLLISLMTSLQSSKEFVTLSKIPSSVPRRYSPSGLSPPVMSEQQQPQQPAESKRSDPNQLSPHDSSATFVSPPINALPWMVHR